MFRELFTESLNEAFSVGDAVVIKPMKKGKQQKVSRKGKVIKIDYNPQYPIRVEFDDGSFGTYQASGSVEQGSSVVLFTDKGK